MMELNNLNRIEGLSKKKKRVGRGAGSGKGFHTTGRGTKGQKARTGHSHKFGFDGGQVPLYKKLPKIRGFRNPRSRNYETVSLSHFNIFEDNSVITPENLSGYSPKRVAKYGIKILANGNLEKKITFSGFMYSKNVQEKIEKSGGQIK